MRNLKFRAWSEKDNSMYYGRDVELWNTGEDLSCRVCLRRSEISNFNEYDVSAIPMQFTGLKDLNCKDIYEGDILEITMKLIGNIPIIKTLPVIFQDGCLGVLWDGRNHSNLFNFSNNVTFEVKGNIHEHGHLLK